MKIRETKTEKTLSVEKKNMERTLADTVKDYDKEFRMMNLRNITINIFTGRNLANNPYIVLNNQVGRLIITMGEDGEQLLKILHWVETFGKKTLTITHLSKLCLQCLKAKQYDRSIKAALLKWTAGVAQGLVKYGTQCGLDALRKLYNKYIPLAEDLQNIFIRQLMSLKPVNEGDVDGLFDEVERIRELYIKVGSDEEPMCERWLKAAVKNLPDKMVQGNAVALEEAENSEEIQQIVNTYLYDYKIGLLRSQNSSILFLTEAEEQEDTRSSSVGINSLGKGSADKKHGTEDKIKDQHKEENIGNEMDLNAACKGKGKGKGQGKSGYGQWWHCGKYGHPRRECPELVGNNTNLVAALKGEGKGKGKGKYGRCNYKGYGKNNGKYNNHRCPGEDIGKGTINYSGPDSEEYWNAWGNEADHWDGYGYNGEYNNYYPGNVMMMLERDVEKEEKIIDKEQVQKRIDIQATSTWGNILGTKAREPIKLCNRYNELRIAQTEDDDDDDDEEESDGDLSNESTDNEAEQAAIEKDKKRAKPNKRHRQRRKEERIKNFKDKSTFEKKT